MKYKQAQANKAIVAIALCLNLSVGTAGSAAIGTAIARGPFRIDNTTVRGNATLFEGSIVETANAASSVQLKSGARFSLERESRGRLFGDRMELEKGSFRFENGGPGKDESYRLVALGLTIRPTQAIAAGIVKFDGANRVQVASTRGSWQVRNAHGQLVANLPSGVTLSFEPQQAVTDVTRVTGILKDEGGRFMLTDEVTHITVEVVGPGIAKEAGKRVEVFGLMDPAAASADDSRVLRVRELRTLGKAETVAATAGSGTAPQGGSKLPGIKTVAATTAVVGGVAVGAIFGGLAAAGSLPGQDETPESR